MTDTVKICEQLEQFLTAGTPMDEALRHVKHTNLVTTEVAVREFIKYLTKKLHSTQKGPKDTLYANWFKELVALKKAPKQIVDAEIEKPKDNTTGDTKTRQKMGIREIVKSIQPRKKWFGYMDQLLFDHNMDFVVATKKVAKALDVKESYVREKYRGHAREWIISHPNHAHNERLEKILTDYKPGRQTSGTKDTSKSEESSVQKKARLWREELDDLLFGQNMDYNEATAHIANKYKLTLGNLRFNYRKSMEERKQMWDARKTLAEGADQVAVTSPPAANEVNVSNRAEETHKVVETQTGSDPNQIKDLLEQIQQEMLQGLQDLGNLEDVLNAKKKEQVDVEEAMKEKGDTLLSILGMFK